MMPALDAAVEHYRSQQALAATVVARARAAWSQVDLGALDESWRDLRVGERLFVTVSTGQLAAATQADPYLDRVLDEQGIDPTATAAVRSRRFAGVASDGRSLETLLYEPVITAKVAVRSAPSDALQRGEAALTRIVATQVQDAGRAAVGTGIVARPAVTGYVRMLNPPSCSRCAVLAGRVYRWNKGFQRHPHCDCQHIPSAENVAGDLTTAPRAYFDSLTGEDQDRYFTKAGAEAIRDGADVGRVVNARRGMATAGSRTTTERAGRRARLTPEAIYADAASRTEAVAGLRRYGYLTD